MSLENKKDLVNKKEHNGENYKEDKYLKNSIDYCSCEHSSSNLSSSSGSDGENEIPIDLEENDLNELALLGFFNDFALVDIGIHEFIREVYFEE